MYVLVRYVLENKVICSVGITQEVCTNIKTVTWSNCYGLASKSDRKAIHKLEKLVADMTSNCLIDCYLIYPIDYQYNHNKVFMNWVENLPQVLRAAAGFFLLLSGLLKNDLDGEDIYSLKKKTLIKTCLNILMPALSDKLWNMCPDSRFYLVLWQLIFPSHALWWWFYNFQKESDVHL